MRIAISGTHRVGKTTLAEALAIALPGYDLVPEPYHLLEEEGHVFAAMPSVEDFELQLERACHGVEVSAADTVFDRSPLDILAYLATHRDADAFRLEDWLTRLRDCAGRLDLICFVPIETPDRFAVPHSEARLRAEVDAMLREIILDDLYGFEIEAMTVSGTPEARLRQVLDRIGKSVG